MLINGNFDLVSAQHNAVLTLTMPGDLPEDVTSTLAHAAGKITVPLLNGQSNLIVWDVVFPKTERLSFIYFERLTIAGCSVVVTAGSNSLEVAREEQIDDYLLAALAPGVGYSSYQIKVIVPDQGADSIVLSPPFLGGKGSADYGNYNYSWGHDYGFMGDVEYKYTKTRVLPHIAPTFPVNSYVIEDVPTNEVNSLYDFLLAQHGKLALFIPYEAESRHDMTLGWIRCGTSPRTAGDFNSIDLAITAKNSR